MKEKIETRGGARAGAGRKRVDPSEKKIQVGSYHHPGDIELIGGMVEAREISKLAIEKRIKALKKLA